MIKKLNLCQQLQFAVANNNLEKIEIYVIIEILVETRNFR